MPRLVDNPGFWRELDKLVESSEVVVNRPMGTTHPRYPGFVYPIDYGYLKGTRSSDNGEIDVYIGSLPSRRIDAILCTVDSVKRDSEIKVLIGCTDDEKQNILKIYDNEYMQGILIRRN